eukprot:SAG31_NODE_5222_length_2666_cov_1.431243_2_plen_99_part_00
MCALSCVADQHTYTETPLQCGCGDPHGRYEEVLQEAHEGSVSQLASCWKTLCDGDSDDFESIEFGGTTDPSISSSDNDGSKLGTRVVNPLAMAVEEGH